MSTSEDGQLGGVTAAPPKPDDAGEWLTDKAGRHYIKAQGRRGIILRQGEESVADALARDAQPPGDRRPKPKSKAKAPPKPPPPSKPDLKELEKPIGEALKQPALVCAMFGDEWAAEHFTRMAPNVARNLVRTAEHNEWLKRKLEAFAATGELPMQLVAFLGLGGSIALYMVPPIVYWFNLPVPDQARMMLAIPPRRIEPEDPFAGPIEATPNGAGPEAA